MKAAVIGLGNISNRHRKNIRALFPQAKIYALSASGRLPDEPINDCDELVNSVAELVNENLDFVIVASPATWHVEHSLPFINADIPVLIEKPLCVDPNATNELMQAERKISSSIAVGYCLRFLPSLQVVKNFIRNQRLGNLYQIKIEVGQYLPDWRPKDYRHTVSASKELGGGALLELSHEIDYAHYLLGQLNAHSALLKSSKELALEVEDSADILASTPEGTPVYIHLDFLQRQASRTCVITGSQGRLVWDLIANSVILHSNKGAEVLYNEPSWDKNQMYLNMLQALVLQNEGRFKLATLAEAQQVLTFIEQVKKQAHYL